MDRSFWNRVEELRESLNGGVEPLQEVQLPTRIIKLALGMFLLQSVFISIFWSVKDGTFWPWLFFISAFLQVGWFWSKVTESWKRARGMDYERVYDDLETGLGESRPGDAELVQAPTINLQSVGITSQGPPLNADVGGRSAREPIDHPLQP